MRTKVEDAPVERDLGNQLVLSHLGEDGKSGGSWTGGCSPRTSDPNHCMLRRTCADRRCRGKNFAEKLMGLEAASVFLGE